MRCVAWRSYTKRGVAGQCHAFRGAALKMRGHRNALQRVAFPVVALRGQASPRYTVIGVVQGSGPRQVRNQL